MVRSQRAVPWGSFPGALPIDIPQGFAVVQVQWGGSPNMSPPLSGPMSHAPNYWGSSTIQFTVPSLGLPSSSLGGIGSFALACFWHRLWHWEWIMEGWKPIPLLYIPDLFSRGYRAHCRWASYPEREQMSHIFTWLVPCSLFSWPSVCDAASPFYADVFFQSWERSHILTVVLPVLSFCRDSQW